MIAEPTKLFPALSLDDAWTVYVPSGWDPHAGSVAASVQAAEAPPVVAPCVVASWNGAVCHVVPVQ